jgi:hypothetical protein
MQVQIRLQSRTRLVAGHYDNAASLPGSDNCRVQYITGRLIDAVIGFIQQ